MQDYLNLNSYFDIETYTETFTYNQLLAIFTAGTLFVAYLINLLPQNVENNENDENAESNNSDEDYPLESYGTYMSHTDPSGVLRKPVKNDFCHFSNRIPKDNFGMFIYSYFFYFPTINT